MKKEKQKIFYLKSYSELKLELGRLDAVVEIMEVSIREFSILGDYKNFEDKVKFYSTKHNIRVDEGKSKEVIQTSAGLYILLSHGLFDSFLKKMQGEVKRYLTLGTIKDSQTVLDFILEELDAKKFKKDPLYKGYEYYRLLRNDLAHGKMVSKVSSPSQEEIEKIYKAITFSDKKVITYNAFKKGEVGFDDFIVFSRILKEIALKLCQHAKPQSDDAEMKLLLLEEKKKLLTTEQFNNYLRFESRVYGLDSSKFTVNIVEGE